MGKILKNPGSSVAAFGAKDRRQKSYSLDDYKDIAQIANKIGKRLLDIGIKYCFHQHTGTTVETEDRDLYMFMNKVDSDVVSFGPEAGPDC